MAAPLGSFPRLTSSVLNRDVAQPLPLRQDSFIASDTGLSLSGTAMQRRAVSQITSISKPAANIPTSPVVSTTDFLPASVPPTTVQLPPTTVSTVIVTSTLAPIAPTTTLAPPPIIPTAVYTTVTQVLTTGIPTTAPGPTFTTNPRGTTTTIAAPTNPVNTNLVGTSGAVYGPPKSSSFSRSPATKASASASVFPSPSLSPHKPKSNVGKYVGYAIGAVFFLTLISSFFSAYRKHRKYVRKRPRGSIFIGAGLSDKSSPQKRSMAQALIRSVSNSSFDAYALSSSPPTSPAPVYLNGSQQSHPDLLNRALGFSPSSLPIRPLPPTPSTKYKVNEDDPVFFPHVPPAVDPHEYSPHDYSPLGVSSSGSSTQTTDARWR